MELDPIPTTGSILQALVLATTIPLISSIIPIQTAMQRNLTDALDI